MIKFITFWLFWSVQTAVLALPQGFVYLHDIAPDIEVDLRYAGSDNFMGRPAKGYIKPRCILSIPAATHLENIQKKATSHGYSIIVYDCYRPQKAVDDFFAWSQNPHDVKNKTKFYPYEAKSTLFDKGYISKTSGHTRGSTVDLSLVKKNSSHGSFDTGTSFDYLDVSAHAFYEDLSTEQKNNRMLLRRWMIEGGFVPYDKEWWHFTLKDEPWPETYFNFDVR